MYEYTHSTAANEPSMVPYGYSNPVYSCTGELQGSPALTGDSGVEDDPVSEASAWLGHEVAT